VPKVNGDERHRGVDLALLVTGQFGLGAALATLPS
jgi:hypothetical protein